MNFHHATGLSKGGIQPCKLLRNLLLNLARQRMSKTFQTLKNFASNIIKHHQTPHKISELSIWYHQKEFLHLHTCHTFIKRRPETHLCFALFQRLLLLSQGGLLRLKARPSEKPSHPSHPFHPSKGSGLRWTQGPWIFRSKSVKFAGKNNRFWRSCTRQTPWFDPSMICLLSFSQNVGCTCLVLILRFHSCLAPVPVRARQIALRSACSPRAPLLLLQ